MKGVKQMSAYSEAASGFVVSGEVMQLLNALDHSASARIVGRAFLMATSKDTAQLESQSEEAIALMVATKATAISQSFRKRQEQSRSAREVGRLSHDSRETISRTTKDERKEEEKGSPPTPLSSKDKKESKEETSRATRRVFVKPTVEEVKAYCEERKNGINPNDFVDFYESKGWMVGKNKMVDWRATVRTWERNRSNASNRFSNGFGNGFNPQRLQQVAWNFRAGTEAQRAETSAVL